ncbi:type II toxin-antitoxin system VapC family toxin [Microbacterium marinum]|uniref:type II toxin-antitoxin system VapC family toxin n=1 Tax=Microbacterium marinum TaxID=421115 RepID=UPI00384F560A
MIIDTSALIALLQNEASAEAIDVATESATWRGISAATLLEAAIVADGTSDPVRSARFDALVAGLDIEVVPLTAAHAAIARQAYRDYGRGSGHPAKLNFGDCFSYALAKERGEPLLYVGDDFAHTDIASALG